MYFSVDVGRSCVDYFFGNLFRDTVRLVTLILRMEISREDCIHIPV